MRVGRLELEPFHGDRLWMGKHPLFTSGPVLVKMAEKDADAYLYNEARLVSEVGPSAPFTLINIFLDDTLGKAGYVTLLPGPVTKFQEALVKEGAITAARRLTRSLVVLHGAGIVYRSFASSSFVFSGDHAIPCDFSRATRLGQGTDAALVRSVQECEEIAAEFRRPTDYDPPEAVQNEYDGVRGDIYGLGILFRHLGVDRAGHASLVDRMTAPEPRQRPDSIELVLAELG